MNGGWRCAINVAYTYDTHSPHTHTSSPIQSFAAMGRREKRTKVNNTIIVRMAAPLERCDQEL